MQYVVKSNELIESSRYKVDSDVHVHKIVLTCTNVIMIDVEDHRTQQNVMT